MARNGLAKLMKVIDNELTDVEPEKAFLLDLERSIELTDTKERIPGSNYYKPSSLGCIRQMYYTRKEVKQDETSTGFQLIGICNNGTDTHIRIQTYISKMKDNGIDCEYVDVGEYVKSRELDDIEIVSQSGMETKLFHNKLKLSFLCDGIIRYKGVYYILELKTEGNNKFWARDGVDPAHHRQATCYSTALGIDDVLFVYINRDNYAMKSFMFNVTGDMKQSIIGLLTNCEDFVEQDKVPPKPSYVDCKYCHYKNQCNLD